MLRFDLYKCPIPVVALYIYVLVYMYMYKDLKIVNSKNSTQHSSKLRQKNTCYMIYTSITLFYHAFIIYNIHIACVFSDKCEGLEHSEDIC
jgi:hypothetical protein